MSKRTEKGAPPQRKRGGIRLSKAEKIAIPVIIIIAVWIVYSVAQPSLTGTGTSSSTTSSIASSSGGAPDFTLPVVGPNGRTGATITLSSFRGKVVLLEFMEPWCPHCQNIAPSLVQLYNKYGGQVVFISIGGPWSGATDQDLANFIQKYDASYQPGGNWYYVYDSSGTIMSNAYGVTATPTFFIVGKDGSILTTCNQGEQCAAPLDADLASYTS